MIWQDWILGITTVIFAVSLLPSILGKDKPPTLTSSTNGTTLLLVAFTQATLALWFAAIATVITSALWLTLAIQKYKNK